MKSKILLVSALLVVVFLTLNLQAQPVIKIKPIAGRHSVSLQSLDTGFGVSKHNLCFERLNGTPVDIFAPSDAVIVLETAQYNAPNPSGKLNIHSQKTADGFLFIANGPKGNNLHLHLKKNASDNARYSIDINLSNGDNFTFLIDYLFGQYLLISGDNSNYYAMTDAINENPYYLESLSLLSSQLALYVGDDQLGWWSQALIGLFQDMVDVEAIAALPGNDGANYFTAMLEGYSDENSLFSMAYWNCGGNEALANIWPGQFIIVNANQQCSTSAILPASAKAMFTYLHCNFRECGSIFDMNLRNLCISGCIGDGGGQEANYNCSHTTTCSAQTEGCASCKGCCSYCFSAMLIDSDGYHQCNTICGIDNTDCSVVPCYNCDFPEAPDYP